MNEEHPLVLQSPFPIIACQKIVEVATSEFTKATGISSICVRSLGMYGPFQDPAQYSLAPRLVHAALNGKPPNLKNIFLGNADDAVDLCYIKDVARAIALLQTAEKLQYDVYNIGSGRLTPNRELLDNIKKVVPNFKMDLPPGIYKVELAPNQIASSERVQIAFCALIFRASKVEKFYMNPVGLTKA